MTTPIDYTSRDYAAIRDDLIAAIAARLPTWTDRSPNDFGIVLIELFATMGDQLNFYVDRVANESFLSTATQQRSVLAMARMLDYRPSDPVAAAVTLTFANSTGSSKTVPALTQVSTTLQQAGVTGVIVFETDASVVVTASSTATVVAHEGTTVTAEAVGASTGLGDQDWKLKQAPLIGGTLAVSVDEGLGATAWTFIGNLTDAAADERVYTTQIDENNVTHVVFGDNVNGKVPTIGSAITATYRVGGGTAGNVQPSTLNKILSVVPSGVTVTNVSAATGGANGETQDSIRTNAPSSIYALNRAVTLADYEALALKVQGVAKAKAVSLVYSSTTLYVAPMGGGTPSTALKNAVNAALVGPPTRMPAGASLSVNDPTYVPINITTSIQVRDQYKQTDTQTEATTALKTLLGFDNVVFGDRISVTDVYRVLAAIPGVQYASVTVLSTSGSGLADVQLTSSQLPQAGTVTVTASGGV